MTDRPYRHEEVSHLHAILKDERIGAPAKRRVEEELAFRNLESRGMGNNSPCASAAGGVDWVGAVAPQRVRSMRFCLPLPTNRTNAHHRGDRSNSRHWTATYRQDERFRDVCDALRAFGALPAPPAVPYPRVRVHATLFVWSEMDDDNAMARCKPALDWLVKRGYVADDRRENIEWAKLPEQVVDRSCPRLVLRISQPKETP